MIYSIESHPTNDAPLMREIGLMDSAAENEESYNAQADADTSLKSSKGYCVIERNKTNGWHRLHESILTPTRLVVFSSGFKCYAHHDEVQMMNAIENASLSLHFIQKIRVRVRRGSGMLRPSRNNDALRKYLKHFLKT